MEPELEALMAAVDQYGSTRQAFGQAWKPFGEGGEPYLRAKERLEPDKAAVEREAAAFAVRLLERIAEPESPSVALLRAVDELDRWRKVLEAK